MDEVLYSYAPNISEHNFYFLLGILVFLVCVGLFVFSFKKNKQLLLLFSGFIGVTAFGVSVFSYITAKNKLSTVQLYKNGLSTAEGKKISFDDIRKIDMVEEEEHSKYPIHRDGKPVTIDTLKLIVIEEYSGKSHILSEHNYPLKEVFGKLKILVGDYKKQNEKDIPTNPE